MRGAPESDPTPLNEGGCIAVYLLLAAIALVPVVVFPYPSFVDHPNHLARLYALNSEPGSTLAAIYEADWALIPNLASDALSVAAHPWISPERLLQLVTVLALGATLLGVALLQRHFFAAVNPSAWLAALPMVNLPISMGYLNFSLGLGLVVVGTWAYLALEGRSLWIRTAVFNALGAALFFCHIAALAIFGAVVALCEVSRLRREGSFDPGGLASAAARVAVAFALPTALVALAEQPEHLSIVRYDHKARGLIAATYSTSASAFFLGFLPLLLLSYGLVRQGLASVAAPMRPVLLGLALLALLLPGEISHAIDLDARVMVCLVFLAIGSTRVERASRRRVHALALLLLAVVSARSLVLARDCQLRSDRIREFRGALTAIEPGAAVLTAGWGHSESGGSCATELGGARAVYWHLPSFAVIDRSAFVPMLFTGRGMQPLRAAPAYRSLDTAPSDPVPVSLLERSMDASRAPGVREALAARGKRGYFDDWPRRFDYLIFLHHGCPVELLPDALTELGSGSFFTLYRVRPGADPAGIPLGSAKLRGRRG